MFKPFVASFASALLLAAAVLAQQTPPPGQEGPPSVEFPPPRVEGGPPPRQDEPPPRVEGAPPTTDSAPPRTETPPPADAAPPQRADRPREPAERCGAVAYTADGAFGAAYGMEDCAEAERLAVDECQRESTDKADCSRGVVTRRDNWFYIQFCRRGSEWTTNITTRRTIAEVNRAASDWARTSNYGSENCRLVPNGLIHSGGLHTKM